MTVSDRRKGLRGQQEVQRLFQSLGIDLDKLAAQGDRIWYLPSGKMIRLEVKRRERLELKMWLRQGEAETPENAVSVVAFRQERERHAPKRSAKAGVEDDRGPLERGEWYAALALKDLIGLVT